MLTAERAAQIEKCAQELIGTSGWYDEIYLEDLGADFTFSDLTQEEEELFYQIAATCATCGWWVDSCECDGEGNCDDCHEESEDIE